MNLGTLLKAAEHFASKNSPAILTAIGVTGTITTAYLTGRASYLAYEMNDNRESVTGTNSDPKERFKERFENVWRLYIPPVVSGTLTVAAIVGANHVSGRRATAMATAYSITERAFSEYRDKVVEKVGDSKEREYRDEIAQDRVTRNPVDDKSVIITDTGEVLCYDHFTGRYFKSSMESLRKAENEVNYLILHQGYASLSEFYQHLNLATTVLSDSVGWDTDQLLEIDISTTLSTDNRPCIAVNFNHLPIRGFDSFGK